MAAHILMVEDDQSMARAYKAMLADSAYTIDAVENGAEALAALDKELPDILLLDLMLPDMNGFDILQEIGDKRDQMQVVIITGHGSMNTAIEAMKAGAKDFLVKPFTKARLLTTLGNLSETQELKKLVKTYEENVDRHTYCNFIGSSLVMQSVYRIIDSAAQSKATVFVTGESGTGKELCAEAIHLKSDRAAKSLVTLNCGAIPKDLMESEIFGHVKGAFTGAVNNRDGAALKADGGTLFLDEICEMELALQPKLLRFLQTGTFTPVGSDKLVTVDCRIVCATNRNPFEEVQAGRFREDLYYRLHVLPMHLPPLRERGKDVLEIAQHFLTHFSAEEGKSFQSFAPDVESKLLAYGWPGNVRQLQNIIRQLVVMNQGDVMTDDMLLPPLVNLQGAGSPAPQPQTGGSGTMPVAQAATVEEIIPLMEMERQAIQQAIDLCDGNIQAAAHHLGISAATIYRKKASWKDT